MTDFPFTIVRESIFKFHDLDLDQVGGVYVVYNVVTDCRYVGCAMGIGSRFRDHYRMLLKAGNRHDLTTAAYHMTCDRNWVGEGVAPFRFAVLEICDREQQFAAELRWIHKLQANYNVKQNSGGENYYPIPKRLNSPRQIAV